MPDASAAPRVESPRLLVSLATYNEAGNIRPLVEAIRQQAPDASILVIDDNSPDGTGQIADELRQSLPDFHVIHRPGKLGLGTATIAMTAIPTASMMKRGALEKKLVVAVAKL